jgi:WD40 repeat protein
MRRQKDLDSAHLCSIPSRAKLGRFSASTKSFAGLCITTTYPPTLVRLRMQENLYSVHKTLSGHLNSISCLQFSPKGHLLASSGDDGQLIIWETSTGTIRNQITVLSPIYAMVWDPRYKSRLFCGCENGKTLLIDRFEVTYGYLPHTPNSTCLTDLPYNPRAQITKY